jgi:hypothetical protein
LWYDWVVSTRHKNLPRDSRKVYACQIWFRPFGQTKSGQEPNIKAMPETGITEGYRLKLSKESASL